MKTIATIVRSAADSPNMEANDAAILECIASELRALGATVISHRQNQLPPGTNVVCHMSRTPATLQILSEAEQGGTIVINRPSAVRNCSRTEMIKALESAAVPQPEFRFIGTPEELDSLHYPAWLKRADGWSSSKDDVCFAADSSTARSIFGQMQARGIKKCVYSRHIEGDIIKFYAVGRQYFHYCYPDPEKSKFGLERINGIQHHYPFNPESLRNIAYKAAEATGVEIYGGDCIVDNKGDIYLIDLNDFPSFTAVRHEAAREIAEYIMKR